jgi:hypothetical protein
VSDQNKGLGGIGVERTDFVPIATQDKERALKFYGETLDTGACHMAFLSDPDGNGLMLHRRYAPYSDGSTP